MTESREALLAHYRESRAALLAVIDGLTDAQLNDPSIDGWSVKHHLAHLAAWDEIRAAEVERVSAGHESAWRAEHGQDETYSAIMHDLRKDLSFAQIHWEITTTRQRLLDAIASATERGLDASIYGQAALMSTHEQQHTDWIKRWRQEKGM